VEQSLGIDLDECTIGERAVGSIDEGSAAADCAFWVCAAGIEIAFFGGLATALNIMPSSAVLETMSYPGIAQEPALL
jgi:hypothetical protein